MHEVRVREMIESLKDGHAALDETVRLAKSGQFEEADKKFEYAADIWGWFFEHYQYHRSGLPGSIFDNSETDQLLLCNVETYLRQFSRVEQAIANFSGRGVTGTVVSTGRFSIDAVASC